MSNPASVIETGRSTVRLATPADVPAIVRYFRDNRAFLAPWEPRRTDRFFTDEFWGEQVRRNAEEAENDHSLRLFIFPKDAPGEVIGSVSFTEFVRGIFQACYLGYGLSAAREGRGYMREALAASIAHVFTEVKMHRIMANHLPHNRRSGSLLKSLGFQVEGYARDYLLIDGRWEDHILTSLTNPSWTAAEMR